jgi:Spy/CpxP family protein refolding chaperone
MILRLAALAFSALAGASALAQHHHQQPYAGQDARQIKALTAEEVRQYLAGAGAGFAKPAELNHYPGPAHVLELADELRLTAEQRERVTALMSAHKAEARSLGARVVDSERAIEALFHGSVADPAALAAAVREAARLQGEYRLAHLETHLRLRPLLTDAQVARYGELRGYANTGAAR